MGDDDDLPQLRMTATLILFLALVLLALLAVRFRLRRRRRPRQRAADAPARLAVFLGSGGHTGEMLRLLETMDLQRYSERVYLLSTGDALSERRVLEVERTNGTGNFSFRVIPRARKVHQSYVTAVFTTSWTLLHCLWLACALPLLQRRQFADVVLLNGPGSCVPLAAAIALPQLLGVDTPPLIYVESLARARRLSLSGKLLRPIVDRFFVQWQPLEQGERLGGLLVPLEYQGWLL